MRARGAPLTIQGFRSNPKDPESHILFFDIEGLIGKTIVILVVFNHSFQNWTCSFIYLRRLNFHWLRKLRVIGIYKNNLNVHLVSLLSDEYATMSPGTLEAKGLIEASEYQKVAALTQSASPDAHKKIAGEIASSTLQRKS